MSVLLLEDLADVRQEPAHEETSGYVVECPKGMAEHCSSEEFIDVHPVFTGCNVDMATVRCKFSNATSEYDILIGS